MNASGYRRTKVQVSAGPTSSIQAHQFNGGTALTGNSRAPCRCSWRKGLWETTGASSDAPRACGLFRCPSRLKLVLVELIEELDRLASYPTIPSERHRDCGCSQRHYAGDDVYFDSARRHPCSSALARWRPGFRQDSRKEAASAGSQLGRSLIRLSA